MVKIVSKATRNPNLFALTGDTNVIHLLRGNTKIKELGMTVEEYHNTQFSQLTIEDNPNEEDNQ